MILTHQRGRGNKIHLLLDDEYKITTDVDFWSEINIADKSDISEEEWENLVTEINGRKALNKAYDLLSRRAHSEKELRQKLLKCSDEESADNAIKRMLELGYLNDEQYAEDLFLHLLNNKHFSVLHIKQEMLRRGINRDIIDSILLENQTDEVSSIIEIINKKYLVKLNSGKDGRDKVFAALARKGFSYSDIKSAINSVSTEENNEF